MANKIQSNIYPTIPQVTTLPSDPNTLILNVCERLNSFKSSYTTIKDKYEVAKLNIDLINEVKSVIEKIRDLSFTTNIVNKLTQLQYALTSTPTVSLFAHQNKGQDLRSEDEIIEYTTQYQHLLETIKEFPEELENMSAEIVSLIKKENTDLNPLIRDIYELLNDLKTSYMLKDKDNIAKRTLDLSNKIGDTVKNYSLSKDVEKKLFDILSILDSSPAAKLNRHRKKMEESFTNLEKHLNPDSTECRTGWENHLDEGLIKEEEIKKKIQEFPEGLDKAGQALLSLLKNNEELFNKIASSWNVDYKVLKEDVYQYVLGGISWGFDKLTFYLSSILNGCNESEEVSQMATDLLNTLHQANFIITKEAKEKIISQMKCLQRLPSLTVLGEGTMLVHGKEGFHIIDGRNSITLNNYQELIINDKLFSMHKEGLVKATTKFVEMVLFMNSEKPPIEEFNKARNAFLIECSNPIKWI